MKEMKRRERRRSSRMRAKREEKAKTRGGLIEKEKNVRFLLCCHRYVTPDTAVLLSELGKTTSKKYHKLNSAIATLVSSIHVVGRSSYSD